MLKANGVDKPKKEVDAEVLDCVEFALEAPDPDPSELTRYIWAED